MNLYAALFQRAENSNKPNRNASAATRDQCMNRSLSTQSAFTTKLNVRKGPGLLAPQSITPYHFIYSVNYDLKVLKIRAGRHTDTADYVVNPAFWPALGIKPVRNSLPIH
jgi:hypothetical protein